eukprot:11158308-Lingulodinium_polyedra.AAC.1
MLWVDVLGRVAGARVFQDCGPRVRIAIGAGRRNESYVRPVWFKSASFARQRFVGRGWAVAFPGIGGVGSSIGDGWIFAGSHIFRGGGVWQPEAWAWRESLFGRAIATSVGVARVCFCRSIATSVGVARVRVAA